MTQQEQARQDESVIASLRMAGVAKQYHRKDETLDNYGPLGKHLAAQAKNGTMTESLNEGRGFFFVGDDTKTMGLFHLTCRAAIFKGVPLKVFTLPALKQAICGRVEEEDQLSSRYQVLAVQGFYDRRYKQVLTEEDIYRVGWDIRQWLMEGKAVILQGNAPVRQCVWWSDGLLELIGEKTMIVGGN